MRSLLGQRFHGDRGALLRVAGMTKARLSQLLDEREPFGDVAARNLESRLDLPPGYFDAMSPRALRIAILLDDLPESAQDTVEAMAELLARKH